MVGAYVVADTHNAFAVNVEKMTATVALQVEMTAAAVVVTYVLIKHTLAVFPSESADFSAVQQLTHIAVYRAFAYSVFTHRLGNFVYGKLTVAIELQKFLQDKTLLCAVFCLHKFLLQFENYSQIIHRKPIIVNNREKYSKYPSIRGKKILQKKMGCDIIYMYIYTLRKEG